MPADWSSAISGLRRHSGARAAAGIVSKRRPLPLSDNELKRFVFCHWSSICEIHHVYMECCSTFVYMFVVVVVVVIIVVVVYLA